MPSPHTAASGTTSPFSKVSPTYLVFSVHFSRIANFKTDANFFFGPLSLLLYGAASFLYELFPSYGDKGVPDLATMKASFRRSNPCETH
jgi:hypothetical protein